MTAETKEDLPPWDGKLATVEEMFLENGDAVAFMRTISRWTHLYDDLIDKDKEVSEQFVHEVMWEIMVLLPLNPFYRQNCTLLAPVIATGILNWRAANDMEEIGSTEEHYISHVIRYSINDIAYLVMTILGGAAHAARYARDARLAFQRDTLAHYMKEREGKESRNV